MIKHHVDHVKARYSRHESSPAQPSSPNLEVAINQGQTDWENVAFPAETIEDTGDPLPGHQSDIEMQVPNVDVAAEQTEEAEEPDATSTNGLQPLRRSSHVRHPPIRY